MQLHHECNRHKSSLLPTARMRPSPASYSILGYHCEMYNPSMFVVVAVAGCTYEYALEKATKGPAQRRTHTNGGWALCVALTAARLSVKKKKRSRATYFGGTHSTSYMLFAPACCILHLSADNRHCLSCQKKEEDSTIEWGVQ